MVFKKAFGTDVRKQLCEPMFVEQMQLKKIGTDVRKKALETEVVFQQMQFLKSFGARC